MSATRITAIVGGAGSLAFLFAASRSTIPPVVAILMAGWVVAPFVLLAVADTFATGWSPQARTALRGAATVSTFLAFAVYTYDAIYPPQAQRAFWFVITPPILVALAVLMIGAAKISARR